MRPLTTTEDRLMTMKLARRYRRLLLAYPRGYRRRRGDELLGTLLDSVPPGYERPTVREAAGLIRRGLRARLGRPASRTVVAWALLTTLITGVFAAALATRLACETSRPLPRAPQTRAMLEEILPEQEFTGIEDAPARFVVYGHPMSWAGAHSLLFGDGGEYTQAEVGGALDHLPPNVFETTRHNL